MKRRMQVVMIVVGLLGVAGEALAIVAGVEAPTGVRNVGTIVVRSGPNQPWRWHACSGVLIGRHAFVTAGHCLFFFDRSAQYGVTFAPAMDLSDPWTPAVPPDARVYAGDVVFHPELDAEDYRFLFEPYDPTAPAFEVRTYPDMAVIVTHEAVEDVRPADLPPIHYFEKLAAKEAGRLMGFAGYGLTDSWPLFGQGDPDWGIRRYSTVVLHEVHAQRAIMNRSPGVGCFHDSGGPVFPIPRTTARSAPPPRFVKVALGLELGQTDADYLRTQICSETVTSVLVRLDTELAQSFLERYADPEDEHEEKRER